MSSSPDPKWPRVGRLGHVIVAGRITQGRGLPPGTTRRHPSFGLTFVTAGRGRYRDAGHDEELGPGTLVLVFPGHPHWYGSDASGWDECFVVFDGALFALAQHRGALGVESPLVRSLPVGRWRHRLDTFARTRPTTVAGHDAQASELLGLLLEASSLGSAPTPTTAWLSRSTELLGGSLAEDLDLEAVASAVDMPYETWRRRFRAATGSSPYQHRAERRLATATDLLLHTGLSTRDVAAATGFSDERHLIRRFRERTGLTPRQFRDTSGSR